MGSIDIDSLIKTGMIDNLDRDKVVAKTELQPGMQISVQECWSRGKSVLAPEVEIVTDGDDFFILSWQEAPDLVVELNALEAKLDAMIEAVPEGERWNWNLLPPADAERVGVLQDTARTLVAQPISRQELLKCLPAPWENEEVRLPMAAAKAGFTSLWAYQQKMKDDAKAAARKARALANAEAKVAELKAT